MMLLTSGIYLLAMCLLTTLCPAEVLQGAQEYDEKVLLRIPETEEVARQPVLVDSKMSMLVWYSKFRDNVEGRKVIGPVRAVPHVVTLSDGKEMRDLPSWESFKSNAEYLVMDRIPCSIAIDQGQVVYYAGSSGNVFIAEGKKVAFVWWELGSLIQSYESNIDPVCGIRFRKGKWLIMSLYKGPHMKIGGKGADVWKERTGFHTIAWIGAIKVPDRLGPKSLDVVNAPEGGGKWKYLGECKLLDVPWFGRGVVVAGGEYDEKRGLIRKAAQGKSVLYVMSEDGKVTMGAAVECDSDSIAAISPDMKYVAVNKGEEIDIVEVSTGASRALKEVTRVLGLSDNGEMVAVTGKGDEDGKIVLVGSDGSIRRVISGRGGATATCTADGRLVYVDNRKVIVLDTRLSFTGEKGDKKQ